MQLRFGAALWASWAALVLAAALARLGGEAYGGCLDWSCWGFAQIPISGRCIHYEDKLVAGQNYDAGYRLTSQTLGNGLVRTISYGRQDNLRTADSVAGKQDLQMTYSYAADKQITADCNA